MGGKASVFSSHYSPKIYIKKKNLMYAIFKDGTLFKIALILEVGWQYSIQSNNIYVYICIYIHFFFSFKMWYPIIFLFFNFLQIRVRLDIMTFLS